jgi:hypothetical protein
MIHGFINLDYITLKCFILARGVKTARVQFVFNAEEQGVMNRRL